MVLNGLTLYIRFTQSTLWLYCLLLAFTDLEIGNITTNYVSLPTATRCHHIFSDLSTI